MLRKKGVVGKFVEFFGPGLAALPLADRATIANMAPEYGATCGFFPVDAETLDYLRFTGRPEAQVALVEAYCKEQGLFHDRRRRRKPVYTRHARARPRRRSSRRLAGPRRPQDRVPLAEVKPSFLEALPRRSAGAAADGARRDGRTLARRGGDAAVATSSARPSRGHAGTASFRCARLGRHRRDHQLHQHLEPVGDARRRPAREEGGRARARGPSRG